MNVTRSDGGPASEMTVYDRAFWEMMKALVLNSVVQVASTGANNEQIAQQAIFLTNAGMQALARSGPQQRPPSGPANTPDYKWPEAIPPIPPNTDGPDKR